MRWFIASDIECSICGQMNDALYPELFDSTEGLECAGCGYMMPEPVEEREEVPESFAKAEFKLHGIPWELTDEERIDLVQ